MNWTDAVKSMEHNAFITRDNWSDQTYLVRPPFKREGLELVEIMNHGFIVPVEVTEDFKKDTTWRIR
jgi:hypothetical protein